MSEPLPINSMFGTAAVGLPLKNADVKVKCRSNNLSEYEVKVNQGSPTTFTIADASPSVQNSVFTGQSLNFKTGAQLPNELGFYQKYYVIDVVYPSDNKPLTFKLSESAPTELTDGPALNIKAADPSKAYFVKTDKVVMVKGRTDDKGLFAFSNMQSLGAEGPCILEASGTTVETPPAPLVLHSMALNFNGRVNITPLTEALLASLVDTGKLNSYFVAFDELSALRLKESATTDKVQAAWEKIKSGLTGLNIDVSSIKNSPITEPLYAANGTTAGNAYDDLLEAIRTKPRFNESEPYKELLGGKQNLITLIKLDSRGVALKNQFGKWSDNGNEKDGTQWDCVHDTANGVYWEVKRNDPSHFRHKGFKYTWFDSGALNGGSAGTEVSGTCQGLADSKKCNTENYVKTANSARLCGFDKWVLPDIESVKSFPLTNSSAVLANTEYFPEMQSGPLAATSIWTRLPSANNAEGKYAWIFNFESTKVEDGLKSSARPVRLMLPVKTLKVEGEITPDGVVKVVAPLPSGLSIANGQTVNLRTTGYLPTPFGDSETYFVVNYDKASSFKLSKSVEVKYDYDPLDCELKNITPCTKTKDFVGTPVVLALPKKTLKGDQFVVFARPQAENLAPPKNEDFCNSSVEVTRNAARYSPGEGEVTDKVTGLVWKQCVSGFSGSNCEKGEAKAATFELAKLAAGDGWRLPTRSELASLVERKCTGVWQYAEAASGLWISTRLFTETGGWEQESNWSNPVVIDSSTAFSADGKDWHLKALSSDVYMGKAIGDPNQAPIKVVSPIRIAGESGYGWRDGIPSDPKDGGPAVPDSTPAPLWMTSAIFSVAGLVAPWSAPVEITKGKGTIEFSTNGYTWHSSPLSSDIYMRDGPNKTSVIIRGEAGGVTNSGATIQAVAFYRGNYGPDLKPNGGTYSSPTPAFPLLTAKSKQGVVTGVAFYRGTLPPFNPIGGSFAYPTPSSPGWADGIPKAITSNIVESAANSAQAINPKVFPQATRSKMYPWADYPQMIWTSDQVPNTDAAWIVNFYNGFEMHGDISGPSTFVRLVKNKTTP